MPAGKIFINALTQGRPHGRLYGGIIAFILALNLIFYIVYRIRLAKGIYNPAEAETYRLFVLIITICSSVMIAFLAIVYLQFKNTTVLVGPKGIAYISFLRKIRAKWEGVKEMRILDKPQGKVIHITTDDGSFVIGPQFVEKGKPLPEFTFAKERIMISGKKGTAVEADLRKSEIFKLLQAFAKNKIVEGQPEPKRKK
jgi:hypothetical protein